MITWKHGTIVPPILLSVLLSACGGGSETSATLTPITQTPDTGAANGGETDPSTPAAASAISGRVADGYIRGATVCIDLNDNEACDDGEPSTTTAEGGVYTLVRPAGSEDKSIIADIPAEAIDEDTGKAVGAKLLFTAPAGKPEFLSPITTLIQQELKSNPALDVDEAEATVKTVLGIDENATVSLFKDYVAEADQQGNDAESSGKYEYLHDTARVIASMMKDIEAQVETAAINKGVDVEGNPETLRAIRELVRNEVRELLPDIARKVATLIGTTASTEETSGDAPASAPIDPEQIAVDLRPSDATDNIDERIKAIRDQGSIVKADMQQLLTDGMYVLELDCRYPAGPGFDESAILEDQGSIPDSACETYYDHLHLNASGDELVIDSYMLDDAASGWIKVPDDSDKGEGEDDYSLVNGKWVKLGSDDASGAVKFTEDGAAVVSDEFGNLQVRAVSQVLDGVPVQHHFWETGAQPAWFDLAGPNAVFNSQSDHYLLSLREAAAPYLLFNLGAYSADDSCAEYNGNCNVVKALENEVFTVQSTLAALREASLEKVELVHVNPIARLVSLTADATEDGSLPVKGKVNWQVDLGSGPKPGEFVDGGPDAGVKPGDEVTEQPQLDQGLEPGQGPEPGQEPGPGPDEICARAEEYPVEGEVPVSELPPLEFPDGQIPDSQLPAENPPLTGQEQQFPPETVDYPCEEPKPKPDYLAGADTELVSSWKLVTVDGVDMIEINMPLVLRHGEEESSEESMLLIEHNGYVRLGARFAETSIRKRSAYNLTAFETLSAIVQNAPAQKEVAAEIR